MRLERRKGTSSWYGVTWYVFGGSFLLMNKEKIKL